MSQIRDCYDHRSFSQATYKRTYGMYGGSMEIIQKSKIKLIAFLLIISGSDLVIFLQKLFPVLLKF